MSVLVFHPSVAVFVQQVARSLHEAGQLECFITAVLDRPTSAAQNTLCTLGRVLRLDLAAQFRRRMVTEVPLEKVESHPWGELLRLSVGRLDRDGRATDFVWERAEHGFDRQVARKLYAGLTGVYGFEHSSLATFQRARDLGLRIAYEVPAAESHFVKAVFDAETARFPELRTAYHRHTEQRDERRIARRRAEWNCADLVIVSSQFTKSTYVQAGLDCTKVQVANLGAPLPRPGAISVATNKPKRPLTLLWAGKFGVLKGAHYLLEAWRQGGFGRHARLNVFGPVSLPQRMIQPAPDGIAFHGSIPRDELMQHYEQADALLFPTLCDGFGMVATEAWSRGLPVIMTQRAGAADLLRPNQNGRLIKAGDTSALVTEIDWCLTHRVELRAMREAALATAAGWQWSNYRLLHASLLRTAGFFSH